jgi:broad specificity phosphatase PhoE
LLLGNSSRCDPGRSSRERLAFDTKLDPPTASCSVTSQHSVTFGPFRRYGPRSVFSWPAHLSTCFVSSSTDTHRSRRPSKKKEHHYCWPSSVLARQLPNQKNNPESTPHPTTTMAPPSHLFVVRHGNRYDVVDKEWHRTSPTPYDPPLSYGGWLQSKALGARIAAILTSNTTPTPSNPTSTESTLAAQRRRYKIVIHSSPFLRCVQTSIAIAAGISQLPPQTAPSSPIAQSFSATNADRSNILSVRNASPSQKVLLRLDPFLGEWLSPDYFEGILAPPSSNLMLAGAKADLLRKVDHESVSSRTAAMTHRHKPSNGALWTSSTALPTVPSSPRGDTNGADQDSSATSPRPRTPPGRYAAPIPNYAVSVSCPIPEGFVSHARDACVVSDYQWDSSRDPFDWGDGGSLPEEWQSMHKRFKRGLQNLVDWYAANDQAHVPVTVTEIQQESTDNGGKNQDVVNKSDEGDVETIVILVSHGAGCNAMIGAITNKPVLIDVNVASLTMAQRKAPMADGARDVQAKTIAATSSTVLDNAYSVSILANTDHYRPSSRNGTPPSTAGWNAAIPFRSRVASMSTYARPAMIRPFTYSNLADSPGQRADQTPRFDMPKRRQDQFESTPTTAVPSSIQESGSPEYTPKASAHPQPNIASNTPEASRFAVPRSGLWAPPTRNRLLDADDDDDLDNMLPDFEHKRLSNSSTVSTSNAPERNAAEAQTSRSRPILMPPIELLSALSADNEEAIIDLPLAALPPRTGLWEGSPRTEAKRRWTVNER